MKSRAPGFDLLLQTFILPCVRKANANPELGTFLSSNQVPHLQSLGWSLERLWPGDQRELHPPAALGFCLRGSSLTSCDPLPTFLLLLGVQRV